MKLSRKQWIPIGILLLFILTNPSISAFKAYVGSNTYSGLKRTTNLFICSIYKHNGVDYFGITGNFFELKKQQVQNTMDASQIDSTSKITIDSTQIKPDTITKVHDPLHILSKN